MRRLFFVLLFCLLAVQTASAGDEEIYYSAYLVLDSEISSTLEIVRQPGASIQYVKAELYFFPKNDSRQSVLEISTKPDAIPADEKFLFTWSSPQEDELRYSVSSSVQVENKVEKVYSKIDFPVMPSIPADVAEYSNPTEKIDSDSKEVIKIANSLAEGEDDLFIIAHKLAAWVNENVRYDLNTVTAEATQKASWVLLKKEGVCDEITALFMAVCRALGIPAKFVSGISYTNDPQFAQKWGPHGWSEVYFPSYGWVPFDVTYGEFGWIDPSHIKLSEGADPDKPSGKIEWRGNNFEVKGRKFDLSAAIKESGGMIIDTVEMNAGVLKKEVGFGSYNLVEAEIKNLRDYYVTTDISLSVPEEVSVEGKQSKQVILKPKEAKKVFWIVRVMPNLASTYVYSFPAMVYNQRNTSGMAEFKAAYQKPVYTYGEINDTKEGLEAEKKSYTKNIYINCIAEKNESYVYEENAIKCAIENHGNIPFENLFVCLGEECKITGLMISQKENFSFKVKDTGIGQKDMIIRVRNEDISETGNARFLVLDEPKVKISEVNYSEELNYDDKGAVEFTLLKESFSDPYKVRITVESERVKNSWQFDSINETKKFLLDFNANDLKAGDNNFVISTHYEDKNGKQHWEMKSFTIKLTNLTITQRAVVMFKGVISFFSNLF